MRKTQYGPFYTPQTHTQACTHTHRHAHGPPRICPPPLTATRPLDAQTQVPSINPDSLILLIHPLANMLAPFSKHAQHPTTAEHLPCPRPGPATPPVHTPCNSPGDVARLLPAPRSAPNTAPKITLQTAQHHTAWWYMLHTLANTTSALCRQQSENLLTAHCHQQTLTRGWWVKASERNTAHIFLECSLSLDLWQGDWDSGQGPQQKRPSLHPKCRCPCGIKEQPRDSLTSPDSAITAALHCLVISPCLSPLL